MNSFGSLKRFRSNKNEKEVNQNHLNTYFIILRLQYKNFETFLRNQVDRYLV
jgi:hypothetical protein